MKNAAVGIIGVGNMGEALIKGIIKKREFVVYIYDKIIEKNNLAAKQYRVKAVNLEQIAQLCDIIIVCVKPQDIEDLFLELAQRITNRHLIISIAAGISTRYMQKFFKEKVPIVRVMPNMPGLIGEGISAYCLGKFATAVSARITCAIFSSIGKTFLAAENKMDAITAVSGSGPGFIAYLADSFIQAAQKLGIEKKTAQFLCLHTLTGTMLLLTRNKLEPDELVKRVASKGGTTEAGLKVFNEDQIAMIIEKAIKTAAKRAKELNKK